MNIWRMYDQARRHLLDHATVGAAGLVLAGFNRRRFQPGIHCLEDRSVAHRRF